MRYRTILSCATATLAFIPTLGTAQTSSNAQSANVGVPEIIVTANRRAEPLQKVPMAVSAISGEELIQRGVQNPQDVERLVSSLTIQNNGGNQQASNFSIRGVGTASFQRSAESSVATVVDDVALIRSDMAIINFVDLESVEVLNGPQGFLFGKNASAGLVNIHSKDPRIGENSARLYSEYGQLANAANTDLFRVQVVGNIATGSRSALRVNAFLVDNSDFLKPVNPARNRDSSYGLRQSGGSAKFLWQATDTFTLLLAGDYLDSKGVGAGFANIRSTLPGSLLGTEEAAFGITPGPDNSKTSADGYSNFRNKVGGAQAKATLELDGGLTLNNILAFRQLKSRGEFDADYSGFPLVQAFPGRSNFRQWSDELRLTSPAGGRFEYQLGLFAMRAYIFEGTRLAADLGQPVPPGFTTFLGGDGLYRQRQSNYALYGQGTYELTPGLKLTAGARVTHDKINMLYRSTGGGGVISLIPVGSPPAESRKETNLSWRASLQYDVDPNVMVYGTAARGYKGPGFAQYSLFYVRPEIPTHFEVGSKIQLLGRKLTLNVAAYNTEFKDFQAQSIDVTNGLTFRLQNAGKLRTRGFDVQLLARPTSRLTLNGGLSYTDARFLSFQGDACYIGQASCAGGVTDSSGNRLPNAPKWKAVADVSYEAPLGGDFSALFNMGVKSQTSFNFLSNADPNTVQKGYTTMDASVALSNAAWGGTVRLFCRNCTDTRFVGTISGHPFFPGDYIQNLTPSGFRQIGASLDVQF